MRFINNEKQPIIAYFSEGGTPKTGLTPTVTLLLSDGTDVTPVANTLTELSDGFYIYPKASLPDVENDNLLILVDGGATLDSDERYKPGAMLFGIYPITPVEPTPSVETDFALTLYQIIEMANLYVGRPGIVYDEVSKNLLQIVVSNLQAKGFFFWVVERETLSFSAPSRVVGNGDSKKYTCYRNHTSAADNRPPTGAYWTSYWYEDNYTAAGATWEVSTAYTTTGQFSPDTDTLFIDGAKMRFDNADYDVDIISKEQYEDIAEKQLTGRSTKLYFEDDPLTPKVYLWPQIHNDDVDEYVLVYWRYRKLSNLEGTSEMENFKTVWLMPLVFLLAQELAFLDPTYPMDKLIKLEKKAEVAVDNARRLRPIKTIEREE